MRTRRSAVLVTAAALALAACGERPSPRDRLAAASEATFAEGSARVSMEMDVQVEAEGSGMSFTTSGDGVVDQDEGTGRMEMAVPGLAAAAPGADSTVVMMLAGDVVYLRLPFAIDGGRRWIRQAAGELPGTGPGRTLSSRPDTWLDALGRVEGEITGLGSDTVRGADVQGYGFTLGAANLRGVDDEARLDSASPAMRDLEIPTRAWLDADDRVRRMVMEIDMGRLLTAVRQRLEASDAGREAWGVGSGMGAMEGTTTLTLDVFDFGADVRVRLPDSTEVTELETLLERARRRAAGDTASGG